MDLDPVTTVIAIVAGVVFGVLRYLDARARRRERHETELLILAATERARRRDKRERRESSGPKFIPPSVPEQLEEETTDTYELVELERKRRRRPGERSPRRGTHHDGEDG